MAPKLYSAEEARALREAATPGPWDVSRVGGREVVGGVADVAMVTDEWKNSARLIAAAPDLAATVEALTAERDALRAIVEGRTTPPTEAEAAAHDAAGGAWLIAWSRGDRPTVASIVSGPRVWWPEADVVSAVALDAQRRPCAWPVAAAEVTL